MTLPADTPYWRSAGIIMTALGGTLMLANAVRAGIDPTGFAAYLGLPLQDAADASLVHTYALRALFIGLLVFALLAMRQRAALAALAFAAVVMPVGDAWLAASAGAPGATVARHVGIALFLLVAGLFLRRDAGRAARTVPRG